MSTTLEPRSARSFFPEYADKQFVGALASLYVEPSVVQHGESSGLLMLGTGDDLIHVLNTQCFQPRRF